jgi:hypothetical protein
MRTHFRHPLGLGRVGSGDGGGTIPGTYPNKKQNNAITINKRKRDDEKEMRGFELTSGRNIALRRIMP